MLFYFTDIPTRSKCVRMCGICVRVCSICVRMCSICVRVCSICVRVCSICVRVCSICVRMCSICVRMCSSIHRDVSLFVLTAQKKTEESSSSESSSSDDSNSSDDEDASRLTAKSPKPTASMTNGNLSLIKVDSVIKHAKNAYRFAPFDTWVVKTRPTSCLYLAFSYSFRENFVLSSSGTEFKMFGGLLHCPYKHSAGSRVLRD